jgi:hypothetical protein
MGNRIVIASHEDALKVANSEGLFPSIPTPGITTELLCMLMCALKIASYWDLAEEEILYLHPHPHHPAVYGLPFRLVVALGSLPSDRIPQVAQHWSFIQDEAQDRFLIQGKWTREDSDPRRFEPILGELCSMARQARANAQPMLLREDE